MTHLQMRLSAQAKVRKWNEEVPIGSLVVYRDEHVHTESWAGVDQNREAAVFITGVVFPVPIRLLSVSR